jgi:hypothetical protein
MKSYLKTGELTVESLGETLQIRELSARAQIAFLELHRAGKSDQTAALVAKHGVPAWADETIEDIENSVPARALNEIAVAVFGLSNIVMPNDADDTKKNPSAHELNGDSSFASQLT